MPHIHAEFSGEEIVMALDGTVLEGSIPRNKRKLLEAWLSSTMTIWKQTGSC